MKFAEKKEAYAKLQDASMLEKDIALLRIKKPDSIALKISVVDREKAQRDILWELLDVASVEDIEKSRKSEVRTQKTGKESHSDQVIDQMNAEKKLSQPKTPEQEPAKKKEKFQGWFKKKPNIRT